MILHEDEVSHQSIRTWKTSPDPFFEYKKRKVTRLSGNRHNPPVVPSADKVGPIKLAPHGEEGGSLTSAPRESSPSTAGGSGRSTTFLH